MFKMRRFPLYAMINKKDIQFVHELLDSPSYIYIKLTAKEYKIRHETPTPKTLSKNYTKTTALERSVASKLPGVGGGGLRACSTARKPSP